MKKYLLPLITFFLTIAGCYGQKTESIKLLDATSFSENIKKVPNAQILDVRTPQEFQLDHIMNATNADILADTFSENIEKFDKKKPIFVYCKSGNRSKKATKKLSTLGFENIYELDGGFIEWQNSLNNSNAK
jgi:rhodanese-related sulfurtransferase